MKFVLNSALKEYRTAEIYNTQTRNAAHRVVGWLRAWRQPILFSPSPSFAEAVTEVFRALCRGGGECWPPLLSLSSSFWCQQQLLSSVARRLKEQWPCWSKHLCGHKQSATAGLRLGQAARDTAHPALECQLHHDTQPRFLRGRVPGFLSVQTKLVFLCQNVSRFCITEGFCIEVYSKN